MLQCDVLGNFAVQRSHASRARGLNYAPTAHARTHSKDVYQSVKVVAAIVCYSEVAVYVVEARRHGEDAHLLHTHVETNLHRPKRHLYRKQARTVLPVDTRVHYVGVLRENRDREREEIEANDIVTIQSTHELCVGVAS